MPDIRWPRPRARPAPVRDGPAEEGPDRVGDVGKGGYRQREVRVATWNVNSVKQRLPRLLPWLDERKPDVVCLQETELTDEAFTELLGAELAQRDYAGCGARPGPVERGGHLVPGGPGGRGGRAAPAAPGFPDRKRGRSRPPAAGSGCTRSTCPTAGSPTRTTTSTSWPGWRR